MAAGPGIGFAYGLLGGILMAAAFLVIGFVGALVVLLLLAVLPFVNLGRKLKLDLKAATKSWLFWFLMGVGLLFGFFGAIAAVVG